MGFDTKMRSEFSVSGIFSLTNVLMNSDLSSVSGAIALSKTTLSPMLGAAAISVSSVFVGH